MHSCEYKSYWLNTTSVNFELFVNVQFFFADITSALNSC